jgi:hypothetical protein
MVERNENGEALNCKKLVGILLSGIDRSTVNILGKEALAVQFRIRLGRKWKML